MGGREHLILGVQRIELPDLLLYPVSVNGIDVDLSGRYVSRWAEGLERSDDHPFFFVHATFGFVHGSKLWSADDQLIWTGHHRLERYLGGVDAHVPDRGANLIQRR